MKKIIVFIMCALLAMSAAGCAEQPRTESENGASDIDLTTMSSTMVYSEVYNMLMNPKDYIGKTVKMDGTFSVYNSRLNGKRYYSCVIADALACCQQGIEFVKDGEDDYPSGYPLQDSKITVTGVFTECDEDGYIFYRLENSQISF